MNQIEEIVDVLRNRVNMLTALVLILTVLVVWLTMESVQQGRQPEGAATAPVLVVPPYAMPAGYEGKPAVVIHMPGAATQATTYTLGKPYGLDPAHLKGVAPDGAAKK